MRIPLQVETVMHLRISVRNKTAMAILLAHLFPAEYKMLWPDIAVCSKITTLSLAGMGGRVQAPWWETHILLTSTTRVFPSLFLCAPLSALWYHWSQGHRDKSNQKPEGRLGSSLMFETEQGGFLLWRQAEAWVWACLNRETGRFETV